MADLVNNKTTNTQQFSWATVTRNHFKKQVIICFYWPSMCGYCPEWLERWGPRHHLVHLPPHLIPLPPRALQIRPQEGPLGLH